MRENNKTQIFLRLIKNFQYNMNDFLIQSIKKYYKEFYMHVVKS